MRSRCSALLLALAACGSDIDPSCESSPLTYDTFGAPFIASWCRGCHSATAPTRQHAPAEINFDTLADVRTHATAITHRTRNATMPPAGGPSDEERALLVEWLQCGAK